MALEITMPVVLVVGADRDTLALLREWLAEAGWDVVDGGSADPVRHGAGAIAAPRFHLLLVDVAYPRRGDATPLQRLALQHAGTPMIVLSATFHANVERSGEVARALGVAGVLPKPVRRTALVEAVRDLSRPPPP